MERSTQNSPGMSNTSCPVSRTRPGRRSRQTLFDPTASLEVKREMLARLARRGTVDAYRVIEQYVKNPDPVLAPWSKIALYECRMALERRVA